MNVELFAAFCLAAAILILMPGPIVTLVVANSLNHGTRTGLVTVAGSSTGNALLVTAGAAGLSTIVMVLSGFFELIRWAGAAYLIWLGIKSWRAGNGDTEREISGTASPRSARAVFVQGAVIAITNPKTILFYIAFFPQFLDSTLPPVPQLVAMSVAMIVIATTFDSMYAVLAGHVRNWFTNPKRRRLQARITGSLLVATGFGLLLTRRNA